MERSGGGENDYKERSGWRASIKYAVMQILQQNLKNENSGSNRRESQLLRASATFRSRPEPLPSTQMEVDGIHHLNIATHINAILRPVDLVFACSSTKTGVRGEQRTIQLIDLKASHNTSGPPNLRRGRML